MATPPRLSRTRAPSGIVSPGFSPFLRPGLPSARRLAVLVCIGAMLLWPREGAPGQVAVRYPEGLVHGFLVLRDQEGARLADGDLIQTASRGEVTSRLVFRFDDGSLHDETTVFTQQRRFRLRHYHLVQKGPSFPRPLEMTIDASSGEATVRHADEDGEEQVDTDRLDRPADLANGLILTLLKNVRPESPPEALPYLAATPDLRLVELAVTSVGENTFTTGGATRKAVHYVVQVEIGGVAGLLAPLLGREPPDSHVWILGGDAPAFVQSEQPLYSGGPVWRIELVGPEMDQRR